MHGQFVKPLHAFRCNSNCRISRKLVVATASIPFKVPIGVGCQCIFKVNTKSASFHTRVWLLLLHNRSHRHTGKRLWIFSAYVLPSNTSLTIRSVAHCSYTQFSLIINTCVCLQLFLNGTDEKEKNSPPFPYTVSDKCVFYFYQSRPFMNIRLGIFFS